MEVLNMYPDLDRDIYPVLFLNENQFSTDEELPDLSSFIAAGLRSENEQGSNESTMSETQVTNDVSLEEHSFCLLDMDKGSLHQLPRHQEEFPLGSSAPQAELSSNPHHHQEHGRRYDVYSDSINNFNFFNNHSSVPNAGNYCTRCGLWLEGRGCEQCEPQSNEDRPYECKVCKKRFTQSGVLKTHALIHKGERRFVCDICNKRFLLAWHLRRHTLTHSGIKPYACDLCGKLFNQSSNLKRHFPTHSRERSKRKSVPRHKHWTKSTTDDDC